MGGGVVHRGATQLVWWLGVHGSAECGNERRSKRAAARCRWSLATGDRHGHHGCDEFRGAESTPSMIPWRAGPFNTHCDQRTKAGSIPATNAVKTRNQAGDGQVAATRLLARWISGTGAAAISPGAFEWARHVMLDWLAVGIAGASEPLVRMLAEEYGGSADLPFSFLAHRRPPAPPPNGARY